MKNVRFDRRTALAGSALAVWSLAQSQSGSDAANQPERDEIWDLHTHLSGVPGKTPVERAGQLLEYADRLHIDRLCIYMGMSWSREPKPDDLKRENDQILEVLARYPDRFLGFAYVSGAHPEASLAEVERLIADGPMVGIKLWIDRHCREEAFDPLIERVAALKAAIFQHTWFRTPGSPDPTPPGESTPDDLVALARRHPQVPLICGHTGGTWELGIRAVRSTPTISIDLAGSDPTAGIVEMAMRELGAERIIYGSDAGGRSFASQLAKVYSADLPTRERRLVLAGNLRRMLAPILQSKGMRV